MKSKLNKDKLNKAVQAILIVLIIFTIGFIWSNSLKPVHQSNIQSHAVAEKIESITTPNDSTKQQNPFIKNLIQNIRKTAHITEFMALGIELSVLSILMNKKNKIQQIWNVFSVGIIIAVVDEALQIISHRGPVVKDILIDSLGLLIGTLLIGAFFSIYLLVDKTIKLKKNNKS